MVIVQGYHWWVFCLYKNWDICFGIFLRTVSTRSSSFCMNGIYFAVPIYTRFDDLDLFHHHRGVWLVKLCIIFSLQFNQIEASCDSWINRWDHKRLLFRVWHVFKCANLIKLWLAICSLIWTVMETVEARSFKLCMIITNIEVYVFVPVLLTVKKILRS